MGSKVSVLMGIYNCADTLEQAVSAIRNQTYTDWEEVYLPRHTNFKDKTNQHMMLLQKRFISDTRYFFGNYNAG